MANRNKEKGKCIEREISTIFSDTFKLNFQRVPNSGAFIGGKNVDRISKLSNNQINLFKGDIIPPDELPNLIIECKGRKNFAFNLLFENSIELNDWIQQVEIDYNAMSCKGLYLLIFKVNRKGLFVCYTEESKLDIVKSAPGIDFYDINYLIYNINGRRYIIHQFDSNWLECNKENIFKIAGKI